MKFAVAQLGQPVLRQVAEPVAPEAIAGAEFRDLLCDLVETLASAGGVGLAAPQVFGSRRVFLACVAPPHEDKPLEIEVFINPRLVATSAEQVSAWEGCLSFPELQVLVPRYISVRVEYLDARGQDRTLELEGFPARVVQHEYDHLEGVLTIDRAASTRDIVKASEMEAVRRHRAGQEPPTC